VNQFARCDVLQDVLTLDGIPLHPLVVHVVVVVLPLAGLGAMLLAVRPAWRRIYGMPVLLLALVSTAAVPLASETGEQLERALPPGNPLVRVHEQRADTLLPVAIAFVVLLAIAVFADRIAALASIRLLPGGAAVLAGISGAVVIGLVVWIGHAGATAVWQGVGT
jgi:hypothetical protein